jgi:TonB family protein
VSILAHLLLVPLVTHGFTSAPRLPGPDQIGAPMRVRFLQEKDQLKSNLDTNGQVVDILDNKNIVTSAPEDARFLSDQNRKVDRETQARLTGLPAPGASSPPGRSRATVRTRKNGYDLTVPENFLKGEVHRPGEGTESGMGLGGTRLAAIAPSNYLPEIAYGDQTILNTREYAFSSFFVRMKRQMEANWDPIGAIGHSGYRREEFVTELKIVLKADGYLERLLLLNSSGVDALDREAMKSVRAGAPFLNPPKQLLGPDGRIEIGPWRFIVALGGATL